MVNHSAMVQANVTWQDSTGGGTASVTISDTPPAASPGDLWWESDTGRLKIRYQDTDSTQWVDTAPPLAPSLSSNAPATATDTGSAGDIRYDSGYVYICVANGYLEESSTCNMVNLNNTEGAS